jgi:hypothetical protein
MPEKVLSNCSKKGGRQGFLAEADQFFRFRSLDVNGKWGEFIQRMYGRIC